ncbi:MAG: hypothetical protein LBD23_03530 [Oscillospiraceae bacterium]|jgi:transglutaminase-like putative cysteine protease|nr:hypothetical protein [Oscillospiraceae bacterium]
MKKILLIVISILIVLSAAFAGWYYWWTTYAVFEYTLQPIVILDGQNVAPEDFLYPSEDMEDVSAAYLNSGFKPVEGRQSVSLVLTKGLRTLETSAALYVLTPIKLIHNEFTAVDFDLDPVKFLSNAHIVTNTSFDVRFTEEPMPLEDYPVGEFTLQLAMNDTPFSVVLYVTDNTPPTATPIDKTIKIGEEVTPEDFVTNIFDASPIASVEFVEKPDVLAHHNQIVEIKIDDIFGNQGIFTAILTIELNSTPPTIEGTGTIDSLIGSSILYRHGVTAYDDFGRELELHVDNSGVDQYTEGVYTVTYWAEDYTGLRTEIEETVHILKIDPDYVNRRVDDALEKILNEDMTQLEKVQAIHSWVRRNVFYSSVRSGTLSVYEGAYIALRHRQGSCYIFYSISEVMLTRAGIPNMLVERIPDAPTRHRWNLVNPDDLGWHHYDSFPTRLGLGVQLAFFTDSQAEKFTGQVRNRGGPWEYYTYDRELYPEVVNE